MMHFHVPRNRIFHIVHYRQLYKTLLVIRKLLRIYLENKKIREINLSKYTNNICVVINYNYVNDHLHIICTYMV